MKTLYIASKTLHAPRWRFLRDKIGYPIISTWINEAGQGKSDDFDDLWRRCIHESIQCEAMIIYREKNEILKGAWIELGAALTASKPIFGVGIEEFTIGKTKRIFHFVDMKSAIEAYKNL